MAEVLIVAGNVVGDVYSFNWAGKESVFEDLHLPFMKDVVLDEPASLDLLTTKNLYIEGDNYDALKFLRSDFASRVNLIYIDPPYNTGNSFLYNDNFRGNEKVISGQGNWRFPEEQRIAENNARDSLLHTRWLNFMYPRLLLAWDLLAEDGVIFISIDDYEAGNLRKICDEIFGSDNFVTQIAWRRVDNQANIGNIARVKEYILCYAKNRKKVKFGRLPLSEKAKQQYRYSDDNGFFRCNVLFHESRGIYNYPIVAPSGAMLNGPWLVSLEKFKELEKQGLVYWSGGG